MEALIGKNVMTVQGEITKTEDLDRLFKVIADEKGKLDILVANSGPGCQVVRVSEDRGLL